MTKDKVLDSLNSMPSEFPLEELLERLIFIQNVGDGLKQSEEDKVIPLEEVKQRLRKWSV